ncbi:hypothetical protein ACHAW6_011755 [Cyclotella cf. meneghiniana]
MLKTLAKNGEIPKKFEKVKEPMCAGFLLGKIKRSLGKHNPKQTARFTKPLILANMAKSTTTCYTTATVLVNSYNSCLQCVHFMISLTLSKTIEAQNALERFAADHGVHIQQYHSGNG